MDILSFVLGVLVTALIAYRWFRSAEESFQETLKAIYWGWGSPDENGNVGWYRDNRHGSPFRNPDSLWAEAGSVDISAPTPPYAPPPPKPKR